jgi:uridine kinase
MQCALNFLSCGGGLLTDFRKKIGWTFGVSWVLTRSMIFWFGTFGQPRLFKDFYGPFVTNFLEGPSFDPWNSWRDLGGSAEAFPYGWPMLVLLAVSHFVGSMIGSSWLGFLVLIIFFEAGTIWVFLVFLANKFEQDTRFVKLSLIISPLPAVSIVGLGSTDVFPMFLILLSLISLQRMRVGVAGVLLGLAIGTKVILVVVVVAFLLYHIRKVRSAKKLIRFSMALVLSILISLSPLIYSQAFRSSIMSSEDAVGPLSWGINSPFGDILFLPIAVFMSWYMIYQLRRMNFDLLALAVAVPLLILAALPGAPIGWGLWAFPILIYLASILPIRIRVLTLIAVNLPSLALVAMGGVILFGATLSNVLSGVIRTSIISVGVVTLVLLWREYVTRGDFARLRARPALVLISGDSGVGKDTLAEGLSRALGDDSSVRISGDDYHRWDRAEGAWKYLTHLNPNANDLTKFFNDVLTLSSGGEIQNGHYDHRIGRRLSSWTARSREFVIASGLHALYVEDVNQQASLKVHLEMSDELRTWLKLKRDTLNRGHTMESVMRSIRSRAFDAKKHIDPQKLNADLQVLVEFSKSKSEHETIDSEITVAFRSSPKIFDGQLMSELAVTCGLEVSIKREASGLRTISVQGETEPILLSTAFYRIEPRVAVILENTEPWDPGVPGIIQLVTMVYLSNALRQERLI